jgi:hypothetical protein
MVVRIFIGIGLFALGYVVGKEMGRAESIRDQLSWAAEEDDLMTRMHDPEAEIVSETSDSTAAAGNGS